MLISRDSANIRFVLNSMQECGAPPGKMTFTSLMRAAGIAGDYTALHTARTQAEESGVTLGSENVLSVLETLARFSRHHLISSVSLQFYLMSFQLIFIVVAILGNLL